RAAGDLLPDILEEPGVLEDVPAARGLDVDPDLERRPADRFEKLRCSLLVPRPDVVRVVARRGFERSEALSGNPGARLIVGRVDVLERAGGRAEHDEDLAPIRPRALELSDGEARVADLDPTEHGVAKLVLPGSGRRVAFQPVALDEVVTGIAGREVAPLLLLLARQEIRLRRRRPILGVVADLAGRGGGQKKQEGDESSSPSKKPDHEPPLRGRLILSWRGASLPPAAAPARPSKPSRASCRRVSGR